MFGITTEKLDPAELIEGLRHDQAGACVTFEGWVRNHNDGRSVDFLEYEAFAEMAEAEGARVVEEAMERFDVFELDALHRIGTLRIGDLAIWVAATSAHRQEAFLACRWAMDRIKERVPVWKKEHYTGEQDPVWVGAGEDSVSGTEDIARSPYYSRQVHLRELGREGQRRLAEKKILVVGAGGLGCPALQYLAAAGVGNITICDGDRVEISNLHRQILFTAADVGSSKALVAADRLRALNPHISLKAIAESATEQNLPSMLKGMDAVLDCTDSFEAKYAIHDAAWNAGVPLIQASVYQFEGQVATFRNGGVGGCYRCLWPEAPAPGCVGNCAETGVLGMTPGLLGTYQAIEAFKVLMELPDRLEEESLLVDVLSGDTRRIRRSLRKDCPCQKGVIALPSSPLLMPGPEAWAVAEQAQLIDIREPIERARAPEWIAELPNVPREAWHTIPETFSKRPLILLCAGGVRTRQCVEMLGFPEGIYAWGVPIGKMAPEFRGGR